MIMMLCISLAGWLISLAQVVPVFCQPSGVNVIRDGKVSVDISNVSDGYVMVRHSGSGKRLKLRLYYGDAFQTYDINSQGMYEALPLTGGSGSYKAVMFENVKGTDYSQIFSKGFTADLYSERAAFLCPNQNVWYTPETLAVRKSFELCGDITDDWGKVETLYNYVSGNIIYDHMKALTVRSPYYASVDDTLLSRTGICLDYASLLACMLRVQGIPTRLVVGDLIPTGQRHAWNKVYVGGTWVQMDATFPNGTYRQSDYSELYFY
ncbi:MAG: transglutaminase-like domain-containing protein [Firmicutes bacterium]|nr:transglutaminase-like domain-containing protein [Bacillota bacterium]